MAEPEDDAEYHARAARAAAAYESHDPSHLPPPPRHTVEESGEGGRAAPPPAAPPRRTAPPPRRISVGVEQPFLTSFFVALGWTTGRALARLFGLALLFLLLGLLLWRISRGF